MIMQRAAGLAALFFSAAALPPAPAAAQDVTLRSRDGAIELNGTLLGFDGAFYRIETAYGELTVDGSGVLCEGVGCPSLTDFVAELTLSGSATLGDALMPALLEAFAVRAGLEADRGTGEDGGLLFTLSDPEEDRAVGRFTFRVTDTSEGFADLLADEADIVMAMREIRDAEVAAAREAGLGQLDADNRSRVVALDALVPVVAPQNPVTRISLAALARVLGGEITEWSRLGGPDAPIALHLRDAGSGLTQSLTDRVLDPAGLELPDTVTRHSDNAALAEAVAADPFAFGIASFSGLGAAKPLDIAGPCGFELTASRRSVKTEDYPLTAPMFLYLPARRLPALAREFLAFTRSEEAQAVIREAGFVDQTPEVVPIAEQGARFVNAISVARGPDGLGELKRLVRVLGDKSRLTTSFRFEAGSADLDAQSRSNVFQLAHAIEAGLYDTRDLMFVGFSDGQGPAEPNLAISRERAEAVRAAVVTAAEAADFDRLEIATEGFGEAMPMACDDTEWGRGANRRVEVWIE